MKKFYLFIFIFKCITSFSQTSYTVINTGTSSHISHLSVKNNTYIINGWSNFLAKSYDDCNTFIPLAIAGPNSNYYNHSFSSLQQDTMYILSANTNWTNEKIYKSTDGGNSWIKKLDTSNKKLDFIGFFNSNEGIAVCESNKILRTKNGGNTWLNNTSPAASPTAFKIYGDSMACVGDSWGGIFLSKDRGNTWTSTGGFGNPGYPRDFFFLNRDTIFGISSADDFTKSFNAGNTWTNSILSEFGYFKTVFFKNKNEGYIIGQNTNINNTNSIILKTINLGQTWLKHELPMQEMLMDIKFMNDSIALISGTNGLLIKWNSKAALFVGVKENINNDNVINVFPNPVKDKLVIESKNSNGEVLEFNLVNGLGKESHLISKVFNSKIEIDIQSLEPGIYYLKVHNNFGQRVFKIAKE